jgi:hypothetical protein
MTTLALFGTAGLFYILANWSRERSIPQTGSLLPDSVTGRLMLYASCLAVGAVVLSVVQMATVVI